MTIAENKVVTLHYEVADNDSGEVIDSSSGGQPLTYLHGARNIIPGLENALEGKAVGDELEVTIEAADAYGERSEDRVQRVPHEAFAEIDKVETGMTVTAQTESGPINLVVSAVDDDAVTVDANHPLAGKALKFNVKVESIRDASDEEVEHGHVHGPEGHDH